VQYWINDADIQKVFELGGRTKTFEEVVTQRLLDNFLRSCKQFFGIEEMQRVSVGMEELMPELSKEIQKNVPMGKLTEVFQRLCAERVSVRNVRQIYEVMNEWGGKERDPAVLTEYARMALRRQICHQFSQGGLLNAFLVSPDTEEIIRSAIRQNSQGSFLSLDPDITRQFLDSVADNYMPYLYDILPPVILVSQDIRRYVRKLIEEEFFTVPVISFSELSPELQVQPLGKIAIEEDE
jgi:type III secretion protein V